MSDVTALSRADRASRLPRGPHSARAEMIQNFAIAYVVLWATSPILAFGAGYRVAAVLAVVVFIFLEPVRTQDHGLKGNLVPVLVVYYILYTAGMTYLFGDPSALVRNIQIYIMFFFACVYATRRDDLRSLLPIVWVILLTMPIWQLLTFRTVTVLDSHAARAAVRSSQETYDLSQAGVGGYGLIYASLLMVPSLGSMALGREGVSWLPKWLASRPLLAKLIIVANLISAVAVIIVSGYSIAVVALVATTIAFLFLIRTSPIRVLLFIGMTALVLIFSTQIFVLFLQAVQPFAEGTNYSLKIHDLLWSVNFGDATGTFAERQERYARSFSLFFDNPILGTISAQNVGKHSAVIDHFAQWGFFIGCIFVYLISFPVLSWLRNKQSFGLAAAMGVAVTCVFFLNNGFASAGVALYILFPVAAALSSGKLASSKTHP